MKLTTLDQISNYLKDSIGMNLDIQRNKNNYNLFGLKTGINIVVYKNPTWFDHTNEPWTMRKVISHNDDPDLSGIGCNLFVIQTMIDYAYEYVVFSEKLEPDKIKELLDTLSCKVVVPLIIV